MSKIDLKDSLMDVFVKLSEGNPGALTACMELYKATSTTDPQAAMGGLMALLDLDDLGVYGSHIWILYKDVCQQSAPRLVLLLRARQLGLLPSATVVAASNGDPVLTADAIDALLPKVKETADQFNYTVA